jgi:hypothetical protein
MFFIRRRENERAIVSRLYPTVLLFRFQNRGTQSSKERTVLLETDPQRKIYTLFKSTIFVCSILICFNISEL